MFDTEQRGLVIEETENSLAPILISLLSLYAGLATGIAGFALDNYALIVAGVAVVVCRSLLVNSITKAMNRSEWRGSACTGRVSSASHCIHR